MRRGDPSGREGGREFLTDLNVQPSSLKAKNVQNYGEILSASAGGIILFIALLPLAFFSVLIFSLSLLLYSYTLQ